MGLVMLLSNDQRSLLYLSNRGGASLPWNSQCGWNKVVGKACDSDPYILVQPRLEESLTLCATA